MRSGLQNHIILQITFQVIVAYKKILEHESRELVACIQASQKHTHKKRDLFTSFNKLSQLLLVCIHFKGWNDQEETNLTLPQSIKVPNLVLGMKHRRQTTLQSNGLFLVMKQSHSAHIIHEVSLDR